MAARQIATGHPGPPRFTAEGPGTHRDAISKDESLISEVVIPTPVVPSHPATFGKVETAQRTGHRSQFALCEAPAFRDYARDIARGALESGQTIIAVRLRRPDDHERETNGEKDRLTDHEPRPPHARHSLHEHRVRGTPMKRPPSTPASMISAARTLSQPSFAIRPGSLPGACTSGC